MLNRSYRLTIPTLAIITCDGEKVPVMIPLGGVVQVVAVHINGNRLIDVIWEGREAMVFAQDLRDRGELVAVADA